MLWLFLHRLYHQLHLRITIISSSSKCVIHTVASIHTITIKFHQIHFTIHQLTISRVPCTCRTPLHRQMAFINRSRICRTQSHLISMTESYHRTGSINTDFHLIIAIKWISICLRHSSRRWCHLMIALIQLHLIIHTISLMLEVHYLLIYHQI